MVTKIVSTNFASNSNFTLRFSYRKFKIFQTSPIRSVPKLRIRNFERIMTTYIKISARLFITLHNSRKIVGTRVRDSESIFNAEDDAVAVFR